MEQWTHHRRLNVMNHNSPWRYGTPAILLHWSLALLIAFMAGLGWYMMTVEHEPGGRFWIDLHKSVGLVVLTLVVLRIVWRGTHAPQALPPGMPRWQVRLAALVQWGLYACMVLVPVTGVLGASHQRSPLAFFGWTLPRWVAPDRSRAEQFFELHEALVWVTVALVALHALGALKHLLVDRDRVFQRMWFGGRA
jgi:cytochrome b561